VPDAARNQGENVTADAVAPGVWFIGGGSHNSVAIEMQDHLILVETPLNDARTGAVMDKLKALAPAKPIRFAVNSHAHFDHAGGVRTAVAEGATIVTQAANVPYFEQVFTQANALRPDAMARAARTPRLRAVAERLDLGDASRPVEVQSHHRRAAQRQLPDGLPAAREAADRGRCIHPSAPNTPPPATPNANNVNLVENIERLKLGVERILPLHGRVVPAAELYAATGRPAPR
jgi:glyoxylase-like metal-dependent hydrolase (beta-lactamase superfamily II)